MYLLVQGPCASSGELLCNAWKREPRPFSKYAKYAFAFDPAPHSEELRTNPP